MVMPYHLLMDRLQDAYKGGDAIGTTGRGIGPAYADKVERIGLRVGDLRDPGTLRHRLAAAVEHKNRTLHGLGATDSISVDEIESDYLGFAERLRPFIGDVSPVLHSAVERNASILLEGAQGTLLDLDHGTYPYATTSACTVAGLCQGAGIPPKAISHAVGVYKAYSTRVGAGPMPTELQDETGDYLREHAHEFGTTTGRARRCGWFDAVVSRYTARLNGFDSMALTRLDILDEMAAINVCVAYEIDGVRLETPPADPALLLKCQPVYEELPGWQQSLCTIVDFEELPPEAAQFVQRIEELVGVPADIVGVGPARSQAISKQRLWGNS
jgi:adenylosuccinate synthase